jgi:hypothetical protein
MGLGVFSMDLRPIQKHRFPLPKGVNLPPCPVLSWENVYHTPGQAAAIRFFDPNSEQDLMAMREILRGKQVKLWMDDANHLTKSDYRDWAGTYTPYSYLFAVLDARTGDQKTMEKVQGFIYIYCEREEKFRVKRMEKLFFLTPQRGERYCLEVSMAALPQPSGLQSGSGLMSSALRQACLQVQILLNSPSRPEIQIFAFVDPQNIPAQRTMESSGFTYQGLMKYDWDSPHESNLYILNWRRLQRKIKEALLKLQTNNL